MAHRVYVVDPATQSPVRAEQVSFHDIGVGERRDLERWVAKDPGLLGEPLLVISSEFSRFDKSHRRLDILALDLRASLVVIELKLDASRSLADQQAIRYAAMCAGMKMDDVTDALARSDGSSKDEAWEKVRGFLGAEGTSELRQPPRIILAAGSIRDQELTNCVLWLRGFGVDISCVEITPYRVSDASQIILVPRTLIPLREAAEFLVSAEHRGGDDLHAEKKRLRARLWRAVAEAFNESGMPFRASGSVSGVHMCLRFGCPSIHYEWILRRRDSRLDVALHFEFDDRGESLRWLGMIEPDIAGIAEGTGLEFQLVPWGRRWSEARFRLPYNEFPGFDVATEAAQVMKTLIERTWPIILPQIKTRSLICRRELSRHSVALMACARRLHIVPAAVTALALHAGDPKSLSECPARDGNETSGGDINRC